MKPALLRWILLLPALIAALFLSIWVFQLAFPLIRNFLGYSQDATYGMSLMDQEFIFGAYGFGIVAFFLVIVAYAIVPQAKTGVAVGILLLMSAFCFGLEDFTESLAICGLGALFLSILFHGCYKKLRLTRTATA